MCSDQRCEMTKNQAARKLETFFQIQAYWHFYLELELPSSMLEKQRCSTNMQFRNCNHFPFLFIGSTARQTPSWAGTHSSSSEKNTCPALEFRSKCFADFRANTFVPSRKAQVNAKKCNSRKSYRKPNINFLREATKECHFFFGIFLK